MILCFRGRLNYVLRLLKSGFKELDEAVDVEIVASDRRNLITLRVQDDVIRLGTYVESLAYIISIHPAAILQNLAVLSRNPL